MSAPPPGSRRLPYPRWQMPQPLSRPLPVPVRTPVAPDLLRSMAQTLRRREPTMLVLSGQCLCEAGLRAAYRISHVTGAQLRTPSQVPRMARGRGRPPVDRIPYAVDSALKVLAGLKHVILVGAKPPTAFFAYPDKPSLLSPPDADIHLLARPEQNAVAALEWLADELGAPRDLPMPETPRPEPGRGAFDPLAHRAAGHEKAVARDEREGARVIGDDGDVAGLALVTGPGVRDVAKNHVTTS